MPKISFLAATIAYMALLATAAYADAPAHSLQETRNLDSATKMHGLQEADHGRIYGWGEHDSYGETSKAAENKDADDAAPHDVPAAAPMGRFHPHDDTDDYDQ